MITGKTDEHLKFAINSTKSFLKQTYDNKELIIINDGNYKIKDYIDDDRIKEYILDEKYLLGELRNFSLDKVPSGGLWVQWDDDDWHHEDFIKLLHNHMFSNKLKVCTIKQQIRYSFKINSAWNVWGDDNFGIEGTIMAYKDDEIRYQNLKKGEDSYFLLDYQEKYKNSFGVFDNPPYLYLRFIHDNNTWDDDNHFNLPPIKKNSYYITGYYLSYLKDILSKYYSF